MWPLLQDGDIVNVKKKKFSNIIENDIICIVTNKKLFTHRVVYRNVNYLITKGDNNATADKRVRERNYMGTVFSFRRNGQIFDVDNIYLLQSSIYFKEVSTILNLFKAHSIEHVVLKGLPIHLYLQKKMPRRIYADCDLLINRNDFRKAEKVIIKCGFQKSSGPERSVSERVEISYYKQINGVMVVLDLHRELSFLATNVGRVGILYSDKKTIELVRKFLSEKKEIIIENEKFYILSPENLLIYLLLHLFNHNYVGPYRYELINSLLKKKINYSEVGALAKRFLVVNFMCPAILLLDKYYPSSGSKNLLKTIEIKNKYHNAINRIVKQTNVFDESEEVGVGKHFKLIYELSMQREFLKPFIFVNISVSCAILRALSRRVARFFQLV